MCATNNTVWDSWSDQMLNVNRSLWFVLVLTRQWLQWRHSRASRSCSYKNSWRMILLTSCPNGLHRSTTTRCLSFSVDSCGGTSFPRWVRTRGNPRVTTRAFYPQTFFLAWRHIWIIRRLPIWNRLHGGRLGRSPSSPCLPVSKESLPSCCTNC